ncbi:MAG: heme biosynthesis HemY N-terminal domain-containing protein [Betaproteobacteria bacterium]
MRAALWLIALFAIAVAVALFAGNNQAVLTLFWPPHRIDLSLNLALLLAALVFLVLHLALRAFAAAFSLPMQARRWRAQQKERAMQAALMDALAHLLAGRFIRASRAAQSALTQERSLAQLASEVGQDSGYNPQRALQLRSLAHLVVAESAQALQDRTLRDEHLRLALEPAPQRLGVETREGIELRAARWALEDREPVLALERLAQLPQGVARRTLALRLRLKAARLARRTSQALETARLLAKHRAFSPQAAQSIVRGLAIEWLQGAMDTRALQQVWLSLEAEERAMPEVAVHASARLMSLGGEASQARQWLDAVWAAVVEPEASVAEDLQVRLITTLEQGLDSIDGQWLARIEAALLGRPRDPNFQYLAGMACLRRQLWGKAQMLLGQAVLNLQDGGLQRRAWRALAQLAEQRGDAAAAQQAWRKLSQA